MIWNRYTFKIQARIKPLAFSFYNSKNLQHFHIHKHHILNSKHSLLMWCIKSKLNYWIDRRKLHQYFFFCILLQNKHNSFLHGFFFFFTFYSLFLKISKIQFHIHTRMYAEWCIFLSSKNKRKIFFDFCFNKMTLKLFKQNSIKRFKNYPHHCFIKIFNFFFK